MSRQGSGPGQGAYGRASDAVGADGDAYQRDAYLRAGAYPVDPGYQGGAGGRERERPRPADMPPGPARTRPERSGMPPRPGYPRRTGWQAAYDPGSAGRPWQRPEDAMPGVGRPRPRPGGPRPRPAGPGPGPGQQRSAPPGYPGQGNQGYQQAPGQEFQGQAPGQFAAEQPWAGQYGPGWAGGAPGQGQPWPQGQPGYGPQGPQGPAGYEPAGYGQAQFAAGQPGPGQPGPGQGPGPAGQYGQYGQAPYADERGQYGGPRTAGQYGQHPGNAGSWQAAGPAQGQDWAGHQQPYGPGVRATGSWQATGPWQGAGPEQGQGWAPGPAQRQDRGGQGNGNAGSWQAAGPQQGPGWGPGQGQFGPGQYGAGQGAPNPGSWQAPGQGWAGPGQPYPGQQRPGQQYPAGQQYPGAGSPGMRNTGGFSRVGSPIIRQRDSALPDPVPVPAGKGPIAAIETDNVAAFARDLRVLRSKAGLDYPDMAEKSHYTMRTLASAAGGLRLPTLPVLMAYVNACGGDLADWEERWSKLSKSGKRPPTALAVPGAQAPAQGPPPQNPRQTGEIYVITSAKPRDW